MKRRLAACGLALALSTGLQAEQLWVRNRPFQGAVQGSGSTMLVEFEEFAKEFGLVVDDQGDLILVGGFPIPVERVGDKRLVSLRDLTDAAGLRLSRNTALGTVDVRSADAGTGSSGDWESFDGSSSTLNEERAARTKVVLEGPYFKVTIPAQLKAMTEETYFKEGDKEKVTIRPAQPDPGTAQTLRTAFAVTTKEGFKKCSLSLSFIPNLSDSISTENEKAMLEFAYQSARGAKSKIVQNIQSVNQAGQRYQMMRFLDVDGFGVETENEFYLQINPQKKVAFLFILTAEKKLFNRVAPQLRLILKTFRAKR